ncbi:DNA primase [Candidatus Peregrinibacteria bacterium CG10_big_fil_rev_8_21_14_0_10_42_8]|nr:MAG: DNA primase [Candidatus Peregrinibacteria bacterium CG10_big_fil_rev_8_21_14_0_10_42_8]
MDPTLEIKAKLPIEELVGQYCQIKKKGRQYVCVCPFHQDTHPSMQVSPDKGIAYCFACNSGGDIFSFYQKIEGVDFKQALKDLGERTGVKVEGLKVDSPVQKDHKERIRECLKAAQKFYGDTLREDEKTMKYLTSRGIPDDQIKEFGIGVAPDSFSDTYQYLLKEGFSRQEIVDASLGIQKDLEEGKIYDRFRNRLMFPIFDGNGKIVGFGGRTLGDDDAKYINSGETPLYNKSITLYGLSHAKEHIREKKSVVLVEGYFDVLACHRIGIKNTIAVSGTALTEQHVKILKRYSDKVVLCLDQDTAGKQAAERSYILCSEEEMSVHTVTLDQKDPDEAAMADSEMLKKKLTEETVPYLSMIIDEMKDGDTVSSEGKRAALQVLLPLLQVIKSSVEKEHFMHKVAALLSTTEVSLLEDMQRLEQMSPQIPLYQPHKEGQSIPERSAFNTIEITLGLFVLFPVHKSLLAELIEPEDPYIASLYHGIKESPNVEILTLDMLNLAPEYHERASILMLFCEHHGFSEWSPTMAGQEIRKNCLNANKEYLRNKQMDIAKKLQIARSEANTAEELKLSQQYTEVLKLAKMASK